MVILKNIDYYKNKTKIIDNLSLECKENKITFIIGPNGSGKTTTLEIIDLLLKIDGGKIRINDNIIDKTTDDQELSLIRKDIGIVFQNPEAAFLSETVRAELEISMNIFKYDQNKREKKINDVLKIVDLNECFLDTDPIHLSKSNKQKLALACVLIGNPSIILLDEPTVGLDSENKEELIKLIRKLKIRYRKTFIISSHDMDFVLRLSDYIYVIDAGKMVMEGNKYDVFKNETELRKHNLLPPPIISFINQANKVTKLRYRDEINDLIKDIYRCVK